MIRLLLVVPLVLLLVAEVAAHPGRTAADGCHYCRTNCDRWNVEADKRHCHGGGSSPTSTTQTQTQPVACPASTGTWRGIRVAPECRCTPYDRDNDYPYPQSIEARIADRLGGMWSPYDGTRFDSLRESDIEHVIAVSEAHDSGLVRRQRRRAPALRARPGQPDARHPGTLNRYQKRDHDAAEWLPERNRCWFAATIVAVRREYDLTIDQREAAALDAVLKGCDD